MVYDITRYKEYIGSLFIIIRRDSFENVVRWLEEVKEHCNSEVAVVLIGNKCDLENEYIVD